MNASNIPAKLPLRLFIVRHGQSAGNVARDLAEAQGLGEIDLKERDMDIPLSQLGEAQAAALGSWIATQPPSARPTRILVSPYQRAQQTAEIARAHFDPENRQTDYVIDERLREREFGLISGLTKKGIERAFPAEAKSYGHLKKFYYRPPGGESWCDVILRLRSMIGTLSRDYAGEKVLIVCHTVVVNCFRYLLDRLTEEKILAIDAANDVANCSVTSYVLIVEPPQLPRLVLERYNSIDHLKDAAEPITRKPDV